MVSGYIQLMQHLGCNTTATNSKKKEHSYQAVLRYETDRKMCFGEHYKQALFALEVQRSEVLPLEVAPRAVSHEQNNLLAVFVICLCLLACSLRGERVQPAGAQRKRRLRRATQLWRPQDARLGRRPRVALVEPRRQQNRPGQHRRAHLRRPYAQYRRLLRHLILTVLCRYIKGSEQVRERQAFWVTSFFTIARVLRYLILDVFYDDFRHSRDFYKTIPT